LDDEDIPQFLYAKIFYYTVLKFGLLVFMVINTNLQDFAGITFRMAV